VVLTESIDALAREAIGLMRPGDASAQASMSRR
jgi:hypothetical protein